MSRADTPPSPLPIELRDGSRAWIRLLRPDDKEALADGFARLSGQSRLRRFMSPLRELSEAQLRYLTEIDQRDHVAWVAMSDGPEPQGLGIARYVRIADEPTVAEAAITVVDSHHGLGLGTQLLRQLSITARANGIETFRAYVLEDNLPMLRLLTEFGASMAPHDRGVLQVETPIPADLAELDRTAVQKVFKAVALQQLPPLAVRFLHDELSRVVKLFAHLTGQDDDQEPR